MSAWREGGLNRGMALAAVAVGLLFILSSSPCWAEEAKPAAGITRLLVVWTTGDKEAALKGAALMYPMYTKQKGWWDEIRLVVWGASQKLLAEDAEVQGMIKKVQESGVEVAACKWCADQYGVSAKLESLGVKVFYVGEYMTEALQANWPSLTF